MKNIFKSTILAVLLFVSFTVSANDVKQDLAVEYTKTDISCFGQSNGKIELCINGGKKPYSIEWNNGSISTVIENLKKGDYSVKVVDANGKQVEEKIKIEMPAPLSLLYNSKKETIVEVVNGSMDVAITGGTPWEVDNNPYYFIQLNGTSQIQNPQALEDGIYKIGIKDARGCEMNIPVNMYFETSVAQEVISQEETKEKNLPYNGHGNVNMTIYKRNALNLVLLDEDKYKSIR